MIVNTVDVCSLATAIGKLNRQVTLPRNDGETAGAKVGHEVINLDEVLAWDLVKVTLTDEWVVFLGEDRAPAKEGAAGVVEMAPKGAKPCGAG